VDARNKSAHDGKASPAAWFLSLLPRPDSRGTRPDMTRGGSARPYAPRFFGKASVRPAPGRRPSVMLVGDDASCFSGVSILALILP